jgi:uncharacterized protein DUF5916/cellulose/xylan binding protein with CBM9 domain
MKAILAILLLSSAAPSAAWADSLSTTCPPVRAARLAERVALDGVLSEAVWQNGNAVTDFKQRDPNEGTMPSQKTEVRVAYDDDAIYVGARCFDAHPESLLVRLSRRDVSVPADRFSFYLDPYHDKRSGYYFLVNAAGTLFDGTLYNDGWEDNSWDGVWEAKAKVDELGWSVEMRIPYSQIRFQQADSHVWGVNFRRVVQRNNEEIFLVYQPKKESGFVSRWPELHGIENIRPPRAIEVLPYVTSKAEFLNRSPLDPFNDGSRHRPNIGGDLRARVGNKLTLNATINPDFGQVEVDPAVVNLSDVESFFGEKRPFFVEGSSIFRFGNQGGDSYWGFNWPEPTFFYSRRIGRGPQGGNAAEATASYEDRPIGTRILGAAKLTGKLTPSINFGTLHALADREMARLDHSGVRSQVEVEPRTYYGVARGLKEFKDRRQGFGLMTTVAARAFDDALLRDQLNASSVMTGFDGWTFLDSNKVWVISGWSALTHVAGNTTRMTRLQQNSRHYFQRPDADHVEVDPNARSLTGVGSRYWLNKQKGSVIFNSALGFISPSFDMADVGFQSRADIINGHIGGGYKWTETTKHRKYQEVLGAVFASYDFQGNPVWGGVWASGFTEFSNNYSWNYNVAYNPGTVNTRRTRGGPLTLNRPGYEAYNYIDTDGKAKLFYFLETYGYTVPRANSYNWSINPGIEWKPASNVTLNVGPGLSRDVDDAYFRGFEADPTATETFGVRYDFARLHLTTVSANIRLNWAFTPTISLQTYIQPLVSAVQFSGFKSLVRPRSYDFTAPAGGTSGYNTKSLRGNAVFRWEYMPGSTAFLVWTREGSRDDDTYSDFKMGRDFGDLLDLDANNIFLAKVSYYFNL